MRNILLSLVMVAVLVAGGVGGTLAQWIESDTGDYYFDDGFLNLVIDIDGVDQDYNDVGDLFDEDALKPGDSGEETLSFHVYGDPATQPSGEPHTANLTMSITVDNYEGTYLEPEESAGDTTGDLQSNDAGELDDFLVLLVWLDSGLDGVPDTEDEGEGDNVWQHGDEEVIFKGTFAQMVALGDTLEPIELDICTTYYVGIYWVLAEYDTSYFHSPAVGPFPDYDELGNVNQAMTDYLDGTITFTVTGPLPD